MGDRLEIDRLLAERFMRSGDVVAEGGAHNGMLAELLLAMGAAEVYGFEPHPGLCAEAKARVPERATFIQAALWSEPCRKVLMLSQRHNEGHTLKEDIVRLFGSVFGPAPALLSVECVRLDDALAGVAVDYLVLDIEGAEPEALAGAGNLFEEHAPYATVCELRPPARPAGLAFLQSRYPNVRRAATAANHTLALHGVDWSPPQGLPHCPPMFVGWRDR